MRLLSLFIVLSSLTITSCTQTEMPELISEGYIFTEGPLWFEGALLFSDIPGNTIYRVVPGEEASVFISPSSNSNGLAMDINGRLLIAQHTARRLVRMEQDHTYTVLASEYKGKRLNSPNDIAVHPDGSVYFTDPPYGISAEQQELDFTGVYRISPDGELHLLDRSLYNPNGIAFSPDHSKLYVSTSDNREVFVYEVKDHQLKNRKIFTSQKDHEGASDGMVTDDTGTLYLAGPEGIWVYSPDGQLQKIIPVPGQTSNVAWGPETGKTLYVTSENAVYRIDLE